MSLTRTIKRSGRSFGGLVRVVSPKELKHPTVGQRLNMSNATPYAANELLYVTSVGNRLLIRTAART